MTLPTMTAPRTVTLAAGTWTCVLHKRHVPEPTTGHVHHVWPRAAGGPDTPDNRVEVCATGHVNVHAVMWAILNGRPVPKCTRTELAMARRGIAAWEAAGRPGERRGFMG